MFHIPRSNVWEIFNFCKINKNFTSNQSIVQSVNKYLKNTPVPNLFPVSTCNMKKRPCLVNCKQRYFHERNFHKKTKKHKKRKINLNIM